MNCERAESLMMDFLYGELSDEITREFFQHLNECENCSGILRDLRNLRNLIQKIPEITDTSIIWKSPHWIDRMRKRPANWYVTAAVAIVLAILSLFVVLNTSFQYKRGAITLRFGTEKQLTSPEYAVGLPEYTLSQKELDAILRYISYLEKKQNAERIILSDQLENLANSTLYEFSKRDEMLQWLISNYALKSEQPTSLEKR